MSDVAGHAEAARVALLNAQRGLRCWDLDPTGTYTESIRQGAAEAIGHLEEVVRRTWLALDALRVDVATADAQRAERVDAQGALDSSV